VGGYSHHFTMYAALVPGIAVRHASVSSAPQITARVRRFDFIGAPSLRFIAHSVTCVGHSKQHDPALVQSKHKDRVLPYRGSDEGECALGAFSGTSDGLRMTHRD